MSHTHVTRNAATRATQQARKDAADKALADKRKKFIKAIKFKQRQLGLDDATYRAMLHSRTGKTSATECNLTELGNVCDYLTRQGATNPKGIYSDGRKRLVPTLDKQALMAKVQAQLVALKDATGQLHTMAYADAICARNSWCTRVDFADAYILHKLVGALAVTLRARQAKTGTAST